MNPKKMFKLKIVSIIIGFGITVILTFLLQEGLKNYSSYISIFMGCLYVGIMIERKGYIYSGLLALLIVVSEFLSLFYLVIGNFDKLMALETKTLLLKNYLLELISGVLGGMIGSYIRNIFTSLK